MGSRTNEKLRVGDKKLKMSVCHDGASTLLDGVKCAQVRLHTCAAFAGDVCGFCRRRVRLLLHT
jgi:hypothetical protein